ncbi:MAG: hypothetical protein AAB375_01610 [Patescibacteria group bacterium]
MFKSIQSALSRRQQSVGRQENVADITQQAVLEFLQQGYSDTSARISVRYQDADGTLIIVTPNKTLAGELMLHTPELRAYLISRTIRIERIVVR